MKNIFKYIFISFGLLFLGSFFVVEKTYGAIYCYDDGDCPGCSCNTGTHFCNICACSPSCLCGCYSGTTDCKPQTNVNNCDCGGSLCGGCNPVYTDESSCTCGFWTECEGCQLYDISGCLIDGDECTGKCVSVPDERCSLYSCDNGYTATWNPVSESCVCARTLIECEDGYAECGDTCCPPGTYCGADSSGGDICIGYDDPEPPDEPNTAPTAPTSLKTEGLTDPNTVSDTTPEFSAIFNDPNTVDSGNYYRIQVNTNSTFTGTSMWDSGKTVMSATPKGTRSPEISYAGSTLTLNGALYYWRIKFWDVGGLESPWSAVSKFRLCKDVNCEPTDYCVSNGFSPVPLSSQSILLEDIVKCATTLNCATYEEYGDCYEDPNIRCTLDTDCDTGCCLGSFCKPATECTSPQVCTQDSNCDAGECCINGECGGCPVDDTKTVKVGIGSKESGIVIQASLNPLEKLLKLLIPPVYAQTTYTTQTDLGYTNASVSGLELNNPINVEVEYTDSDGVNDMEALYFWMTRTGIVATDTRLPKFLDEIGNGSNAQTESNYSYGFMLRRTGNDWNLANTQVYIPELTTAGDYWVKSPDQTNSFFIYGPKDPATGLIAPMVRISNIATSSPSSTKVILSFGIEFLHEYSGEDSYQKVFEGTYRLYAMVNDVFGFTPYDNHERNDNFNELEYFSRYEIRDYDKYEYVDLLWLVDLTPPELEAIRISVTGDNQLGIYWKANDGETGLGYVVGNVYRDISHGGVTDTITYLSPDPEKEYTIPVFNEDLVGHLYESSLWKKTYLGTVTMEAERTEYIDVGGNTGGSLDFHVTVFDKGGNVAGVSDSFSLAGWLISKGGIVYSTGGTDVIVRLLDFSEGEGWPSDLWYSPDRDEYPGVVVFDPDLADLSTEGLAGNVDYEEDLYDLIHSAPLVEGGKYNKSVKILQEVGILRNSTYLRYKDMAENQLTVIGAETVPVSGNTTFSGKTSDYCGSEHCVVNTSYQLTVDSGFICDSRMLFLTSGDIVVRPDLMNEHNTDGCIFVAGGNISIEEGTYASEGSTAPRYDIVEGYFLADGVIDIEAGDAGLSVKDGLQVNGGLIAFGGSQSIVLNRDMKLKDKAMYPSLAVHAAPGYGKIALEFFGPERSVYKQEVGYKPF